VQKKQRLLGFGVDFDIVCECSELGLVPRSAAFIETTRTQLDIDVGVLGTIDRGTRDDFLRVPARVKRQVRSRHTRR
jgi:hypothetical protein